MATQQGDVGNITMGVADVDFGGTNLGLTKGGVVINITQETVDVVVDNWGVTPVNSFDVGQTVEIVVPMAEETLEKLGIALPKAIETASGKLTLGTPAGTLITPAELVINPITSGRENFIAYRARPKAALSINYNVDDISVIEVTFAAMIDSSRPEGDQLCRFGGPAS